MASHGLGYLIKISDVDPDEPVLYRPVRSGVTANDSPVGEWVRVAAFYWQPDDAVDYAVRLAVTAVLDAGSSGQIRARVGSVGRVTTPMVVTGGDIHQEAINRPLPWLTLGVGPQIIWLEARMTSGEAAGGMRILRAEGNTAPAEVVGAEPAPAAGSAIARLGNLHAQASLQVLGGVVVPVGEVQNIIPPVILGAPTANVELVADLGSWENAVTFEYQWEEEVVAGTTGLSGEGDLGGLTASAQMTIQAPNTAFSLVTTGELPFSNNSLRTVVLPSTILAGDLIEIYINAAAAGDPGAPTAPGYTRLYSQFQGGNYWPRVSMLYKVATGADAGATVSVSATPAIAERNIVSWAVWRGVNATTPYAGAVTTARPAGNDGNYNAPAISTTVGHVVAFHLGVENTTPAIPQAAGYERVIHQLVTFAGPNNTTTGLSQTVQWKRSEASTEDPPIVTGTPRRWEAITRAFNVLSPVGPPPPQPTVPDAPTIGTATAGNTQATVDWTAPANNGGSPLTGYSVQVRTGTTVINTITGLSPSSTSRVVTGLTNGTAYNFRVIAINAVGASAPSASSSTVTPTATGGGNPPPSGTLTLAQVNYDMWGAPYRTSGMVDDGVNIGSAPWGKHEVGSSNIRHGRPTWDWYEGARPGQPPTKDYANVWGQLFPTNANTVWNVRLQVRRVMLWFLTSNNTWVKAKASASETTKPSGGWYRTQSSPGVWDFSGANADATPWVWVPGEQAWETPLHYLQGQPATGRALLHWFYDPDYGTKATVPAGCKAVLSHAQMRLVPDSGTPNIASSQFVASFSTDNWPVASGPKPPGVGQISAFVQPRMKKVTASWNWFTGYSLITWYSGGQFQNSKAGDNSLLQQFPPPVVGRPFA